ncbi:MAG: hypothetical protein MK078_00185 [Crocinitomicaceae bacterium]|nr:hypothetical protein [Crocinitomicaceae bacterium]
MGQSRQNTEAKAKLTEAINMWLETLKESNVGDKKSRINKKVTALFYACLAETYLWINEFDKATHYANLAINADVMKFKNHGKRLISLIANQKLRYNANY